MNQDDSDNLNQQTPDNSDEGNLNSNENDQNSLKAGDDDALKKGNADSKVIKDDKQDSTIPPVHQKNVLNNSSVSSGGDTQIGDRINELHQNFSKTYVFKDQQAQIFDVQHLQKIEIAILEKETSAAVAVFDSENLAKFKTILLEKRILLIHGEADIGKVFLSKKLAVSLTATAGVHHIYKSRPLYQNLNIDLSGFLEEGNGIRNSVMLFPDFLEPQNHSIKQLFLNLRNSTIKNLLLRHLKKHNAYLIFTSNQEFCEEVIEVVSTTKIVRELERPSLNLLEEAFDKTKNRLLNNSELKTEQIEQIAHWLTINKLEIVESLGKIGALNTFIQRVIFQVKRQRMTKVTDAFFQLELDKMSNLSEWFATELKQSEELWFWAISFTICQAQPGNMGISVSLFETIRRSILAYLNKEGLTQNEHLESTILRSEELFIERCQAEVYQDPTTNVRRVRFRDSHFKDKVWATLLKYYFTSISRIFKEIEKLANHKKKANLRNYAALILGRLSEGFPDKTRQILRQWAVEEERQVQIGYFYLGLWAVHNKKHRDRFLNFLVALAQTGGRTNELHPTDRQRIHAAIRAYTELGPFILKSTIKAYGNILENRLGRQMLGANEIGKSLDKFDAFQKMETIGDVIDNHIVKKIGHTFIQFLFAEKKEDMALAVHIQFAIIHLCLTVDTAAVFKELNKWMLKGNHSLQLLLLLLFLGNEGIIHQLSSFSIQIRKKGRTKIKASCHPIVYTLLSGDAAVRSVATFIKNMMDSFDLLPLQVRRVYRQTLFLHLRKWVRNSLKLPFSFQNPMIDLYVELMLISKELEEELKWDMDYQFTEGKALGFRKAVWKKYAKRAF